MQFQNLNLSNINQGYFHFPKLLVITQDQLSAALAETLGAAAAENETDVVREGLSSLETEKDVDYGHGEQVLVWSDL